MLRIARFQCTLNGATAMVLLAVAAGEAAAYYTSPSTFCFALLGDRTGEAQPGVFPAVWKQVRSEHPDFVVTVGDTIQGGHDAAAAFEWREDLKPFAAWPPSKLFFAPGNHDVWSVASAKLYEKYTRRPLHYSFDYANAHFTVLDNSRSDDLRPDELRFLEDDLKAHRTQPLKFVLSHRPSWLIQAVLGNPHFALHQLARQYGVQYVIAGHLHQMLAFEIDGVHYLSMASAGGHLRASKKYEDGWFFGHALITVNGGAVDFAIEELPPPFGEGKKTRPPDWGAAGLSGVQRKKSSS